MEGVMEGALPRVQLTLPPEYSEVGLSMVMVMIMALPMTVPVVATATEQLTEL